MPTDTFRGWLALALAACAGFVGRMGTALRGSRGIALGLCVLATGLAIGAPAIGTSEVLRRLFVERPLRACDEHSDGPRAYNAGRLEREFDQLPRRLRTVGLALAVGALGYLTVASRLRERLDPWAATLLLGAWTTGAFVVVDQVDVVEAAVDRGMPGASREERFLTLYPDATRAAQRVTSAVPPDARVLVIDFADPDHLHVFGYVAFPIRVYTPTDPNMQFPAATFRALLRSNPDVARECAARGYVAAIDLRGLVSGNPEAIILLDHDGAERR